EERAQLVAEAQAALYPSLASALFRAGARRRALAALEDMARGRVAISIDAANRLIRAAQRRRDLRAVFAVLDAMTAARVAPNDDTYEAVANAAVRSVEFVTGAVSMETLPRKWLPEAAFIGRSNVGKSSLVNMVCNRKALAYTSKRPGKTQQLNFFEVNGGAAAAGAGDGEAHAFYLVDMPGHGYAKVSEQLRTSWQDLLKQYVAQRRSLRVLFHLLDGRHGPVGHDKAIMKEMARLPSYARYVIVLTKADKQDNTVSAGVMAATITALREAGVENAPVVITSAETKLGRDAMWRYLRLAALDRSGGGRAAATPAEHGYGKEVE
ncbi:P-loop containing nucleoside triphosphate hydrolase protein, partial [Tribonema minus]